MSQATILEQLATTIEDRKKADPSISYVAKLLTSGQDKILKKVAEEAAKNALKQLKGATPRAVIIFNCIARHKLFGERAGEEISAIQKAIGKDVPLIGFYTYGEQAPMNGDVKNIKTCNAEFHNETVVICVLGE